MTCVDCGKSHFVMLTVKARVPFQVCVPCYRRSLADAADKVVVPRAVAKQSKNKARQGSR